MKILTRDFGEQEIESQDILEFVQPLYGFEEYRKYILLYESEASKGIAWLQSTEEPEICFFVVDPAMVFKNYNPVLPGEIQNLLGDGGYLYRLVTVVPEDFRKSTVNLKSPIVINPERHTAAQVILDGDYPIRLPLIPAGEGEGSGC